MKTQKAFGWLLAVSLVALAAPSMIGCGGVVSYGGGDGDGDGGAGGEGGGDGSGGFGGNGGCDPGCPSAPETIAMTYAQIEATQGGSGGSNSGATTGVGGGPDPGMQFLMFGGGTEAPACGAPYGSGGCGGWRVSLSVASALFQVGVISFSDPGLDIFVSESQDEGNGSCSGGGGGGFEEGQLEILEITPETVRFAVSGVTSFFSNDPNGERTAYRCQ